MVDNSNINIYFRYESIYLAKFYAHLKGKGTKSI